MKITATEARNLVQNTQDKQTTEEMCKQIEKRAAAGLTHTFSDGYLSDSVVLELKALGFIVTNTPAVQCHKIEW